MNTLLRRIAIALVGIGALSGCSTSTTTQVATSASTIAAPASGSAVDAATFAAAITLPNTVIVDVRTPEEFAAGHIAGAVNLNVEGPDFASQVAALDKSKTYALYCHSGNRSGVARDYFVQQGFDSYDLAGGVIAWDELGKKLTS